MTDTLHLVCPHCDRLNRLPATRLAAKPRCGACKGALLDGPPHELNDEDFDRWVERNELPVVVDFWAEWCGPCKSMAPHYARAAESLAGTALFAKLETDRAPNIASRYAIRSIPTVALFKDGDVIDGVVGAAPIAHYTKLLDKHLAARAFAT